MTAGETHQAIEAIFRIERARLVASLARVVRNVFAQGADLVLRGGHIITVDKDWRLARAGESSIAAGFDVVTLLRPKTRAG